MATEKLNHGEIPCPCCGGSVGLFESPTGKLSYSCWHLGCEATGYAGKHTGAAKKWLSQAPKKVASEPPKAPEKVSEAEPKPEETKPPKAIARSAFSMGGL